MILKVRKIFVRNKIYCILVTESMQRESAIAEDFWHETLQLIEEKSNREHKQTCTQEFQ